MLPFPTICMPSGNKGKSVKSPRMPHHRCPNALAADLLEWRSRLARLSLYYHDESPSEACIICLLCGFAIKADGNRVTRHLHEKHQVPKAHRAGLHTFIRALRLPDPSDIRKRPDGSRPHPQLALQRGFACRHCGSRSSSMDIISRHLTQAHSYEIKQRKGDERAYWLRNHVDLITSQSWTAHAVRHSWLVKPDGGSSASPEGIPTQPDCGTASAVTVNARLQAFTEQLAEEETNLLQAWRQSGQTMQGAGSVLTDAASAALVTNWLRRTGWVATLDGANRRLLVALTRLPSSSCRGLRIADAAGALVYENPEADSQRLLRITDAVDWLLDCCHGTVRGTDVSIRRWLRSKFPGRPCKAPFGLVSSARSEKTYRAELKRYLCFYLRLSRLSSPGVARAILGYRTLAQSQLSALRALWTDSVWNDLSYRIQQILALTKRTKTKERMNTRVGEKMRVRGRTRMRMRMRRMKSLRAVLKTLGLWRARVRRADRTGPAAAALLHLI
jgi:hypothetical protein